MKAAVRAIVTDIEGTTSSLSFVKDVLFPYARARLPEFTRKNATKIADILNEIRVLEKNDALDVDQMVGLLLRWMDEDRKITPLKTLQGLIWKGGYESGDLKGHIYEDAYRALQAWHDSGIRLYVYSSGSIAAQKLLFGYTDHGDLTNLFAGFFDTTTGPKIEAHSYRKIATDIGQSPESILFLSDNPDEIAAALQTGCQAILIDREGTNGRAIHSFDHIRLQEKAA